MKYHFGMGSKNLEKVSHEDAKKMKEIYYDPKHGFSGVDDLIRNTGYSRKKVEEFLDKQKNIFSTSQLNIDLRQEEL